MIPAKERTAIVIKTRRNGLSERREKEVVKVKVKAKAKANTAGKGKGQTLRLNPVLPCFLAKQELWERQRQRAKAKTP
jgi:hypothetical protein